MKETKLQSIQQSSVIAVSLKYVCMYVSINVYLRALAFIDKQAHMYIHREIDGINNIKQNMLKFSFLVFKYKYGYPVLLAFILWEVHTQFVSNQRIDVN